MNVFELISGTNNITGNILNREEEKPDYNSNNQVLHDIIKTDLQKQYRVDKKTHDKYSKYGVFYTPERAVNGSLDRILADAQSNWEKLGNAIAQTLVSEIGIGIPKGFSDLTDIILGKVFQPDNDYTNPISAKLEEWQEKFNNEVAPIYSRPGSGFGNGTDFGWWMQNIPSIASTLTLLIPGASFGKVGSLVGKGVTKAIKATTKFDRKAVNGIRKALKQEELSKIGKVENWINRPSVGTQIERHFGNVTNALAMRTIENYQESRQTYNDMYDEAYDALNKMSDKEYQEFLSRNSNFLDSDELDVNDRQAVAKHIAKRSADETFKFDMKNLLFDVIQIYTLGNPLRLPKSLRATRKINKAHRESKIFAKYGDIEGQKILDNRKTKDKVKDFIGDYAKSRWIITSELSEGLEEAVNYIAQQEGIHFGNTILGSEDNYTTFDDRLTSYIHSPELWESAFWGVLGGVVFQTGGSGIKRAYNATVKTISKNKNADEKDKVSWKEEFQTTENKTRIAEIEHRYSDLQKLKESYNDIYVKGESPFEDDSTDGRKRKLETQTERDAAWNRAIDEYITHRALQSMDVGNYDLFKAYLRDENVRSVLESIYQQDDNADNKIDVESLIKRMDEVEKIYSDNLIAVNGLLGDLENVPLEMVSLIARDNTTAALKVQRLQHKIDAYKQSAEANEFRFKGFLDENYQIPYDVLTSLVTATNYLKELKARKEQINSDKKLRSSISGQVELNAINDRINTIQNYVRDLKSKNEFANPKIFSFINNLFSAFQSTSETSEDYISLIQAISDRDIKSINKITGSNFELNDDEIVQIFGENGTESGLYYVETNKILEHFGVSGDTESKLSKFVENAPNLADDYTTLSSLEIAKLIEQGKIVNTPESVKNAVHKYNNILNEARALAIDKANQTIVDLAKKYGRDIMLDHVFNGTPISDITEDDSKLLKDSLDILNLTNPSNEQLNDLLYTHILLGDYERSVDDAKSRKTDDTADIEETSDDTHSVENDKIKIDRNIDSGISIEFVNDNDTDGLPYIKHEDENGNETYEVVTDDKILSDKQRNKLVENSDLFDGYDKSNKNTYKILSNPIITYDNNNNIVIRKGSISYNEESNPKPNPEPTPKQKPEADNEGKPKPPIFSTGEKVSNDNTLEDNDYLQEQLSDEEALRKLEEEERLLKEMELRSELRKTVNKKAKQLKEAGATNDELVIAVDKMLSDFREQHKDEPNIDNIIATHREFIINKYDLLALAEKVDNLRSSTTIESEQSSFSDEFKEQVKQLILEYIKAANIRQPKNGKLYINFEDFIRNINKMYDDTYAGEDVYNRLKNYLSSDENKDIILTDDINDPDFLENVLKDEETRRLERIGKREKYRVSIDKLFDRGDEEFKEAFDELKVGDVLDVTFSMDRLFLTHNGRTVGELPFPTYTIQHDGYKMPNKSWIITVYHDHRKTNIRNYLSDLANDDAFSDLIYSFLYDDLSDSNLDDIVNKIFNKIHSEHSNFLIAEPNKYDVVEFIANIWRYKATPADFSKPANQRFDVVDMFIDDFFDKLYDSYDAVTKLAKAILNGAKVQVKVANLNDGELIRNVSLDPNNMSINRDNYDKFTQSNKAFKPGLDVTVGAVTSNGTLTLDGGTTKEHSKLGPIGTIHIIVPNRSGKNNFVIGTAVTLNDENIDKSSDAHKIIQGAKKYLNDAISLYLGNPSVENYNSLVTVIDDLLNNENKRVGLFFGKYVYHDKDGISIRSQKGNRNGKFLKIYKPDVNAKCDFTYNSGKENETAKQYLIKDNAALFTDALTDMLNDCRFNLSFQFLASRYSKDKNNSIIGYTSDKNNPNKFAIGIKGRFYFEYDSLTDAFIKGGLIRVNTRLEDGSNYRRKGENQGANQILEVSLNVETSPVEENDAGSQDNTSTTEDVKEPTTAEEILNTESADNAVDKLVKLALPNLTEDDKNELKDLELLPKSIIFVPELKDNNNNTATAQADVSTNQVSVSNIWTEMFNGTVNGKTNVDFNRKQAIRKLIHEQLHVKIHKGNVDSTLKSITSIYDEFKAYMDKSDDATKSNYSKYLYDNKTDNNERLEEFLVDSITSKELAELLSNIETTYEVDESKVETESLWTKILNLIANIFNYDINNKGNKNLLQKELYALQNALVVEEEKVSEEPDELSLPDDALDSIDGFKLSSTTVEKVPDNLSMHPYTTEMQQIKDQATDNNGEFSRDDNNIYSSTSVETAPTSLSISSFIQSVSPSEQPELARLLYNGEIVSVCR